MADNFLSDKQVLIINNNNLEIEKNSLLISIHNGKMKMTKVESIMLDDNLVEKTNVDNRKYESVILTLSDH